MSDNIENKSKVIKKDVTGAGDVVLSILVYVYLKNPRIFLLVDHFYLSLESHQLFLMPCHTH